MNNFTPFSALLGGVIIGLSVVFYFYMTGRLAG
ncbi:MAG: YeeE/YedE family protein, partial [Gammaproteobacteria bacterium]|nr:YeeE/YedE family protein [Gammaproteobacteria bacterium]